MSLVAHLNLFDFAVFLFLASLTFAVLVISHKRNPKDDFLDYMLMGRKLTLPAFTATLVATWYGGIIGVTEIAFQHGLYNFITQGVFWYLTYLVFAFFMVDKVRSYGAVTLPELVGMQFGPIAAKIAAVFNFFNVVPIAYVLSCGLVIEALFGISLLWGMAISTALVCAYSMIGGFRSVVVTDIIQFACMCSSVAIVLVFAVSTFGGMDFLESNLPAKHFSVTGGNSIGTLLVWGFIALSTLVDPNFYQRCFAASTATVAKRGILFSTLIWCAFDLCTTFGAMYAAAALPNSTPSQGYLELGLTILPHGLKGFFLVGLLATIVSTMDSYIFIASNTLTYDLFPAKFRTRIDLSRIGICLVGVVAIALAQVFEGSVREVWKTLGSYSAGCLMIPMISSFLWPRFLSERDFIWSVSAGALAITYWRWAEHNGFWSYVDDLYAGLFATGVTLATCVTLTRVKQFFPKAR